MAVTLRTADFIDSIEVNVHLEYKNSKYGDAANALASLNYLGLDHVRDAAAPDLLNSSSGFALFANAGVKFDFLTLGNVSPTDLVTRISTFAQAHPGSVAAIEGPNEINNFPFTYEGLTSVNAAVALLDDVVALADATPSLAGVDIYDLTGAARSTVLSNDASQFANIHPYPQQGNEPMAVLQNRIGLHSVPGKGMVITEAGYFTGSGNPSWEGVDQTTQAKLELNLLADAAKLGIAHTYLYQLLDPYADPTGSLVDRNIGLFTFAGQPKQAAVAIHNLTTILADPGAAASSFTPHGLTYTLSGLPASGDSMLMEKSSGVDDLVLWAEPDIWNQVTHTPITVKPSVGKVDFGGQYVDVKVFDPLASDQPIKTFTHVTQVQLAVSDHPVIVEVTGGAVPAGAPPATHYELPLLLNGTAAADVLLGAGGDDTLKGNAGADHIDGGAGNDLIIGGAGGDTLTGGAGADLFSYRAIGDSPNSAPDQIMDFSHADGDRLDLSSMDANGRIAGNQQFHLGGSAFTRSAGELIQTAVGDGYLLQGDLNGDGRSDFQIMLHNLAHPLVSADFIL
jgi:hypothetical protein